MGVEIVTSWQTLMARASAVGAARESGDQAALEKAQADLEAYEEAMRVSDRVVL